jgi:hypothetical protein
MAFKQVEDNIELDSPTTFKRIEDDIQLDEDMATENPVISDDQAEILTELSRRKNFGMVQRILNKLLTSGEDTDLMRLGTAGREVLGTIATGAIAEPIAGIGGLAKTITSGAEEGTKTIEQIRDYITYKPQTEEGMELLRSIGNVLEPVTKTIEKAESGLGDYVYEKTGSPTLAAAATTIPTAISEALGYAGISGTMKGVKGLAKFGRGSKATKAIKEAAPPIDALKDTARGLYKEIGDAGGKVKAEAYNNLVLDITDKLNKKGLDKDLTKGSYTVLDRLWEKVDNDIPITSMDQLRQKALNAINPDRRADSNLSRIIIESIDDFMDDPANLTVPSEVGSKYKIARDLWGRARRSELLQEAVEKARDYNAGFDKGLSAEFKKIYRNKKTSKYFKDNELKEMKKVGRGTVPVNIFRLAGKLGIGEGGTLLGGTIGFGLGSYFGGAAGGMAVPVIGTVSRRLAKRLTDNHAKFADQVVRAGSDAGRIAKAYLKNTPVELRDPSELAQLLMRQDIKISELPKTPFMQKAASIAEDYRTILAESIAATEAAKQTKEDE